MQGSPAFGAALQVPLMESWASQKPRPSQISEPNLSKPHGWPGKGYGLQRESDEQ
jgi:hypothetical protein